jgi:hypothetical protein
MRDAPAMSRSISVAIDLSETMLRSLGRAARRVGVSPTEYLHAVLASALEGRGHLSTAETIGGVIAVSEDWLDLQSRLRRMGYVLRRSADGPLMLHDWPLNRPVLLLEELGYSLATLTLTFGAAFPADVPLPQRTRRPTRRAA